jgi:aspartyl-tRNA(Asn)/glutamyl-tRNA(Gln) amidotransferase subunit B
MKYEPVIGLEVHVELNTKSKMFCKCSADYFGKKPNTHTCPVCLGLPGALPYINEEAIKKCIQIGLALNCEVSEHSLFERKNYFYPDLPKGYQISQYRWPLCVGGWIDVEDDTGNITKIRINRAHQEEDTGKLMHIAGGGLGVDGDQETTTHEPRATTFIDYNRSSLPLVEIVTEPDFTDSSQIKDYAKKLQQIFRYLGVSNADMERGDMRLEANVSVRPVGQKELPPYRVELKNINSFRFMVAAVEYEIKRQIEAIENGEKLIQETRGWNEDKRETYTQRVKEEANDYRYFPEPDLPEMKVYSSQLLVDSIRNELPELPMQKEERYINELGISKNNASVLSESRELADFFEQIIIEGKDKVEAQQVANLLVNQKIKPGSKSTDEIINQILEKKSGVIEDESELRKIAAEVITENEQSVAAYKGGKETAIMALVGGVMRKTQGKANAQKAREILKKLLDTTT